MDNHYDIIDAPPFLGWRSKLPKGGPGSDLGDATQNAEILPARMESMNEEQAKNSLL